MNMQTFKRWSCPCCGGFIGDAASIADIIATLAPNCRTTIFKTLSHQVGKFVTKQQIMSELYGYEQPSTGAQAISVYMSHLRKEIAPFGWMVECSGRTGGRGSEGALYRLVPAVSAQYRERELM